jgi:hypothetical protein
MDMALGPDTRNTETAPSVEPVIIETMVSPSCMGQN